MSNTDVKLPKVVIYTDGACRGNPGPGGWGALLISGEHKKELNGGDRYTTNNRMEMIASIEALKALKQKCNVDLYTDSKYLKNGIEKWLPAWKKNNWRTAQRGAVKNQDLWELLDHLVLQHSIRWCWVKGHAGNAGNERADNLAKKGLKKNLS
ncbi:MAG: ribonuclease HI [Gammaproteobacteria bacterium]|nr:ribonuclease HI [Gammaproteobacteria bacterium]MCY4274849.1 ribonuclease HI [Gammaproteobacteria bacterium]